MHGAETHREYHRERHGDLVRAAGRREAALELAVARDEERRSLLPRAWQRRFGRPAAPSLPATT